MPEPKLLVDSMLGKVGRWLVLLGFDAAYAAGKGRPDSDLLAEAQREGRIFVTRDTKIPPVAGVRVIVLKPQRFEEQMKQVLREAGLKPDRKRLFSRCTVCNKALDALSREEALPLVPELVRALRTEFFRCPACARVYWGGTHTERTLKKLEAMGLLKEL